MEEVDGISRTEQEMIPLVAPCYPEADDILNDSRQVSAFEEEFAEYVECTGAIAVNSGTSALMVVLYALAYQQSVGVPSFSCRALVDAIKMTENSASLIDNVCDVPNANFSMRYAKNVEFVVVPHMFGTMAINMIGMNQTAIDDITLSLGAVRAPLIGVCSFHQDKMISTGVGGMIVAQDEAFLERCREIAYYNYSDQMFLHYQPAFSFGMSSMQAALGRSQLRQLPMFIERRKEIAERYTAAFREVGIETPNPGIDSVFFRYIIGVDNPAEKVEALATRSVEAGRGVNPPLHKLLGQPGDRFPGAEQCYNRLLSVPVHPGLTDEQVQFILVQVLETCAP